MAACVQASYSDEGCRDAGRQAWLWQISTSHDRSTPGCVCIGLVGRSYSLLFRLLDLGLRSVAASFSSLFLSPCIPASFSSHPHPCSLPLLFSICVYFRLPILCFFLFPLILFSLFTSLSQSSSQLFPTLPNSILILLLFPTRDVLLSYPCCLPPN